MPIKEITSIAANFATIFGVPIAIFLYLNEKRKERIEREYGTYNALDEKYIEYLRLCMNYPKLNLYYFPTDDTITINKEEEIQQYAMFEILISMLERAFLMYRDQSNEIKKKQWDGWNQYMYDWGNRKIFRQLWNILGHQFDDDFADHMNHILEKQKLNFHSTTADAKNL